MQPLPHHYSVSAGLTSGNQVEITCAGLPTLQSAPPQEFGGPGDCWSPETLLVAAVADCFLLTFKAIARASDFAWQSIHCDVEGVLDRIERKNQFTRFTLNIRLQVGAGQEINRDKAERLLQKAENSCLISNSLKAQTHLNIEVV